MAKPKTDADKLRKTVVVIASRQVAEAKLNFFTAARVRMQFSPDLDLDLALGMMHHLAKLTEKERAVMRAEGAAYIATLTPVDISDTRVSVMVVLPETATPVTLRKLVSAGLQRIKRLGHSLTYAGMADPDIVRPIVEDAGGSMTVLSGRHDCRLRGESEHCGAGALAAFVPSARLRAAVVEGAPDTATQGDVPAPTPEEVIAPEAVDANAAPVEESASLRPDEVRAAPAEESASAEANEPTAPTAAPVAASAEARTVAAAAPPARPIPRTEADGPAAVAKERAVALARAAGSSAPAWCGVDRQRGVHRCLEFLGQASRVRRIPLAAGQPCADRPCSAPCQTVD